MANTLNRRGFLARLGLSVGAVSIGAAASSAAAAPVAEDPALLALGEDLVPALATFHRANDAFEAAAGVFHASRPAVPAELQDKSLWGCGPERTRTLLLSEKLTDADGRLVYVGNNIIQYASANALRRALPYHDGRTTTAKKLKRLLSIAERYEAEDETVRDACRIYELRGEKDHAQDDLLRLCNAIADAEARTLAGIEIKAGAIAVAPLLGEFGQFAPVRWGPRLAANLLEVLKREV